MRSICRLYANTSKGNDPYLYKQLLKLNILSPKYDQHLHSFFFDGTFEQIFDLSFSSHVVENMYVQIGQPFQANGESYLKNAMEKLQFKNYLPIRRGLVESISLKILIRQSTNIPSENVLTFYLQNALEKEIVKKEYYQHILGVQPHKLQHYSDDLQRKSHKKLRDNIESYHDIKAIVDKKWEEEDIKMEIENNQKLLELQKLKMIQGNHQVEVKRKSRNVIERKTKKEVLQKGSTQQDVKTFDLPFNPSLTLYICKNKGRILLKMNNQEMYKHGWKKNVGWGPIRESIVASILSKTQLLTKNNNFSQIEQKPTQILKLWDPFCGSGTIPLVASSLFHQKPIRNNYQENFIWHHWSIYKPSFLAEYQARQQQKQQQIKKSLKIIASDINFQTINYTIKNMKEMVQEFGIKADQNEQSQLQSQKQKINKEDVLKKDRKIFHAELTDQIYQIVENKIICLCGDFDKVIKNLTKPLKVNGQKSSPEDNGKKSSPEDNGKGVQDINDNKRGDKLNIVTNLPYTHGRSAQHMPLNQLLSVYKRFSKMISENKAYIDNVYVVINNGRDEINNKHHFLNVSQEKWNLIANFDNGGIPIGLYAWHNNQHTVQFQNQDLQYANQQSTNIVRFKQNMDLEESQQEKHQIADSKKVEGYLVEYRQKIKQIQGKYYQLPEHLYKKDLSGRAKIKEKKRKRHLERAYQIFSRRKDKLMAFSHYAQQKLEVKMLKRGTIWRKKNITLIRNQNLLQYQEELKKQFSTRIEDALKQSEIKQKDRKQMRKVKVTQQKQKEKVKKAHKKQIIYRGKQGAFKKLTKNQKRIKNNL